MSVTSSGLEPQLRGHMASTVLEFAHSSDSLPAAIASFAHPVHVDTIMVEMERDEIVSTGSEEQAINAVVPTPLETESRGAIHGMESSQLV